MKKMLVIVSVGMFLLCGASALAQDKTGNTEDVTEYFMDADNVEGNTLFPNDGIVNVRRKGKSKSLIKVRQHFVREMIKAVEDI